MKLYQIDVKIAGTAYITAESVERARELLDTELKHQGIYVAEDSELITGESYEALIEPGEERVTLSPVMTCWGAYEDQDFEEIEP